MANEKTVLLIPPFFFLNSPRLPVTVALARNSKRITPIRHCRNVATETVRFGWRAQLFRLPSIATTMIRRQQQRTFRCVGSNCNSNSNSGTRKMWKIVRKINAQIIITSIDIGVCPFPVRVHCWQRSVETIRSSLVPEHINWPNQHLTARMLWWRRRRWRMESDNRINLHWER